MKWGRVMREDSCARTHGLKHLFITSHVDNLSLYVPSHFQLLCVCVCVDMLISDLIIILIVETPEQVRRSRTTFLCFYTTKPGTGLLIRDSFPGEFPIRAETSLSNQEVFLDRC